MTLPFKRFVVPLETCENLADLLFIHQLALTLIQIVKLSLPSPSQRAAQNLNDFIFDSSTVQMLRPIPPFDSYKRQAALKRVPLEFA